MHMKNCLFSAALAVCAILMASSCSKTNGAKESENQIEQQEAFDALLGELDCLNNDFGIATTKGGGRDALKTAADIAGYVAGNAWGADACAWVGSAAGPAGAVVGFLVGRRYGGVVGSQIFSLVAGYGYDLFSRCEMTGNPPIVWNTNTCKLRNNASIGEVHNFLLATMSIKDEDFISFDGQLDIEAICNESIENARMYGIDDNLLENEEYVAFIKDFSKEIERMAFAIATNSTEKSSEQYLKELLVHRTSLSETEINNMFALSATLMGSSDMEECVVEEYENAFSELVDNSDLSDTNKNSVKSVGSIAIRSNYYWYAEK